MTDVLVYCQDASHEAKRAKVAEFSKRCYPCEILECETQAGKRAHLDEWVMQFSPGVVTPDGQDPRQQVRGYAPPKRDKTVWRYRLECPLCGLTMTAREGTLHSALDTLAGAGVDRVTLGAFAARVASM